MALNSFGSTTNMTEELPGTKPALDDWGWSRRVAPAASVFGFEMQAGHRLLHDVTEELTRPGRRVEVDAREEPLTASAWGSLTCAGGLSACNLPLPL
jgi:hypothetical protein